MGASLLLGYGAIAQAAPVAVSRARSQTPTFLSSLLRRSVGSVSRAVRKIAQAVRENARSVATRVTEFSVRRKDGKRQKSTQYISWKRREAFPVLGRRQSLPPVEPQADRNRRLQSPFDQAGEPRSVEKVFESSWAEMWSRW